jgi:glycosyltransferase involved in cell wall biosynthesis
MIRQLNLGNNVKVLISPEDIHGILLKGDIYLSTSLFEGLSNSVMEAMSAGLPIVATDVGDTKYLVRDSYNGFLVPRKDIDLITSKLQELIDSGEKRKEFGENSYSMIKKEFSEGKMLAGYNKLFSEIALLNSVVTQEE